MTLTEAFLGPYADDLFVSVASVPDAKELQALDVEGQTDARDAIAQAIRNAQRMRPSAGSRIALVKGEVGSGKTHVLTTALQSAAGQPTDEVYPVILQLTAPVTRETYERWLLEATFREVGARHFASESARSPLKRLAMRLLERVPTGQSQEFVRLFQEDGDEAHLMACAVSIGKALRLQGQEMLAEDPPSAGFIACVLLAGFGDWSALNYLRRSYIDTRMEPLGLLVVDTPVDRIMVIKDLGMTAQIVGASLAIGFDQVENAVRLGSENLFVHALVQAIRVAESVLNVAILIAVLADEYDRIAAGTDAIKGLTAGDLYRIEREQPTAVRLERPTSEFLHRVVAQRLNALREREGLPSAPGSVEPLPDWFRPRVEQARSVRGALRQVNRLREQGYRQGRMPSEEEFGATSDPSAENNGAATATPAPVGPKTPLPAVVVPTATGATVRPVVAATPSEDEEPSFLDFDKLWADHRDSSSLTLEEVPDSTKGNLIAWWVRAAAEERTAGEVVEVHQRRAEDDWKTHLVEIQFSERGTLVETRVVALCEAPNRDHKLAEQIEGFLALCKGTPIALRTKGFPKGANAQPAEALAQLEALDGMALELGEIEWHALQEAKLFADAHRPRPEFMEWRRERQWLLQLIPSLGPIVHR